MTRQLSRRSFCSAAAGSVLALTPALRADDKKFWKEGQTLKGHTIVILCLGISADGSRLVSSCNSSTACVWDTADGKLVTKLTFKGPVNAAALSGDGKLVVTGSDDKTLKVWDATTGKEVRSFGDGTFPSNTAVLSRDGKRVAANSAEGARVWDVATGKVVHTLPHENPAKAVAFNADGTRVVTCTGLLRQKFVKVWDAKTGKEVLSIGELPANVASVAFSPDGKAILGASFDNTAKVWDAKSGKELRVLKGHTGNGWVNTAAYSPDGKFIVTGGDDKLAIVWDAKTGREVARLAAGETVGPRAVFGKGNRIFATRYDAITVWEPAP